MTQENDWIFDEVDVRCPFPISASIDEKYTGSTQRSVGNYPQQVQMYNMKFIYHPKMDLVEIFWENKNNAWVSNRKWTKYMVNNLMCIVHLK